MTLSWRSSLSAGTALALLTVAVPPSSAEAQFLDKVKKAVKRGAESEVLTQVERKARGKVRCVFDDFECIRKAEGSGEGAVLTDDEGTTVAEYLADLRVLTEIDR